MEKKVVTKFILMNTQTIKMMFNMKEQDNGNILNNLFITCNQRFSLLTKIDVMNLLFFIKFIFFKKQSFIIKNIQISFIRDLTFVVV